MGRLRSLSSIEGVGAFLSIELCLRGMARSPGSRWPVITAGSGGTMNVGSGFFGFLTLGGRPLAARRLARMRFLYCFQSQATKIMVQMVMTAALETIAETMGVLARWLFEREKWCQIVGNEAEARVRSKGGLVHLGCWKFRKTTYP